MSFIDANRNQSSWEPTNPNFSIFGGKTFGSREAIVQLFSILRTAPNPDMILNNRFHFITPRPEMAIAQRGQLDTTKLARCVLYDSTTKRAYYPVKTFQEQELQAIKAYFDQNVEEPVEFIAIEKENWKQLTEEIESDKTKAQRAQPLRTNDARLSSMNEEELLFEQQEALRKEEKVQQELRALHARELERLLKKSFLRVDVFEAILAKASTARQEKIQEIHSGDEKKQNILLKTVREALQAELNWNERVQQEIASRL
jgi:hypothetical protein